MKAKLLIAYVLPLTKFVFTNIGNLIGSGEMGTIPSHTHTESFEKKPKHISNEYIWLGN